MKSSRPHILCVNPWIHDFAAYDFWAKPLGLLSIAAILRLQGAIVSYIDCQDRFHPESGNIRDPMSRNGRGPYMKTPIPKPVGLESVNRTYCRYGIQPDWFCRDLKHLPKPDLVLLTCLMTYWYPGLFETIRIIRSVFPEVPVAIGGVYATLCPAHAEKHAGADYVVTGPGEVRVLNLVEEVTGFRSDLKFDPDDLNTYPFPALDLQRKIGYVPLLTSRGCPFGCTYCASKILHPRRMLMDPARAVEEIEYWQDYCGVKDVAFYDDALLVNAKQHAIPLFQQIIQTGRDLRFHTPNAVHIREITPELATLMRAAGVRTLRLGLETMDFEGREIDRKVKEEEFICAVSYLKAAGFKSDQVGAYLLVGLPNQEIQAVEQAIHLVKKNHITPILAYYTPIPHTDMWPAAVAASRYDLAADPVFTNNAIMPCRQSAFEWNELARLKRLVKEKTGD